ncbi:hypothetical protein [Sorangium sp. So ce131]|uniref:hypothetical protein n=1 Tax=Sorangium sp. So ce131 TaxID=3133282 RepID=UPI003F5DECAD
MPDARAMRCGWCGGAVPVTSLAPTIRCPRCSQELAVPPELLREIGAYQQGMDARLQSARAQVRPRGSAVQPVAVMGCMGATAIAGAALVLPLLGLASGDPTGPLALAALLGAASMGALVLYGRRHREGRRRREVEETPAVPAATLACPNCGGPNRLQMVEALNRCRSCGAALIADRSGMARALDAADRLVVAARIARYRDERRGWSGRATGPTTAWWAVASWILGLTVVSAPLIAWVYGLAVGVRFDAGWVLLLLVRAVIPLLAAVAAISELAEYFSHRRVWAEVRASVERLFAGRAADVVRWLNTVWAGPIGVEVLRGGPFYGASELPVSGFSALLVTDVGGTRRKRLPPKLWILLAAWLPGLSEHEDPSAQERCLAQWQESTEWRTRIAWFDAAGFDLAVTAAGLTAAARSETLERWSQEPDQAEAISLVVLQLEELARFVRARPIVPGAAAAPVGGQLSA